MNRTINVHGLILEESDITVVCMCCKRHLKGPAVTPDSILSHGLCEPCLEINYPEFERNFNENLNTCA
jgi:hypothetical protein